MAKYDERNSDVTSAMADLEAVFGGATRVVEELDRRLRRAPKLTLRSPAEDWQALIVVAKEIANIEGESLMQQELTKAVVKKLSPELQSRVQPTADDDTSQTWPLQV